MKIVIVASSEGEGGRLAMCVPEEDLWAVRVLCARAGQEVLKVEDESDAS